MRHSIRNASWFLGFSILVPALLALVPASPAEPPSGVEPASVAVLTPTKDQARTQSMVLYELNRRHYNQEMNRIDDRFSSRLLDRYLDFLDPRRWNFLGSDIADFERYRLLLDNALRKGNLDPAFDIFNRYQQRRLERLEYLQDAVGNRLDELRFDVEESFEPDRENAPWPATRAELEELWRKLFKSEVLSLRLADQSEEEIAETLSKRYENQRLRIEQTNRHDVFRWYMNAFTQMYDPHTEYFPPRQAENFDIDMSLSLEGIGALLEPAGEYTRIQRLVPGGPAEKGGQLKASDRIVGVGQGTNGEILNVVGWRLDEVVDLIRGQKGTTVRLEILSGDAPEGAPTRIISIVRDRVKLEEQEARKKVLELERDDETYRVGIIELPAFYMDFQAARAGKPFKSSNADVQRLIAELREEEVDGIVIDLRNNGGGSLYEARQFTGLFLPTGSPIVQVRRPDLPGMRRPVVEPLFASPDPPAGQETIEKYTGPIAVLVNRLSASASEIFAGAIQDYGRGLIVGSRTFGKGTVQNLAPLDDGQIKLTQMMFYRVSGSSTQKRGVVPDVEFPPTYDNEEVGEEANETALPWSQISPTTAYRGAERDRDKIAQALPELRERHERRAAEDPDFRFTVESQDFFEERRKDTRISLSEKQRRAEQEEYEAELLAIENRRRVAKGLDPLETFEDLSSQTEEPSEIDAYARETANVLVDWIDSAARVRTVRR